MKKVIISAIIEQVQQDRAGGGHPPEDVPALMTILRSTAQEQLSLVQSGTDEKAMQAALGFARWIKLPTLLLGEARNAFKAAREREEKDRQQHERRRQLGLESSPAPGSAGGHEGWEEEGEQNESPDRPQAAARSRKTSMRPLKLKMGALQGGDAQGGGSTPSQRARAMAAAQQGTPQLSQRTVRKKALARRMKAHREATKRVEMLQGQADALHLRLVLTQERARRGVATRSQSRADDIAQIEFEHDYASPLHMVAKSPRMMKEQQRWRPALGSISEGGGRVTRSAPGATRAGAAGSSSSSALTESHQSGGATTRRSAAGGSTTRRMTGASGGGPKGKGLLIVDSRARPS